MPTTEPSNMVTTKTDRRDRIGQNVTSNQTNFERVQEFHYMGATTTSDDNITTEIDNSIHSANLCCFALRTLMRSKNVYRKKKETPIRRNHKT